MPAQSAAHTAQVHPLQVMHVYLPDLRRGGQPRVTAIERLTQKKDTQKTLYHFPLHIHWHNSRTGLTGRTSPERDTHISQIFKREMFRETQMSPFLNSFIHPFFKSIPRASGRRVPAGGLQMLMLFCLPGFLEFDYIKNKGLCAWALHPAWRGSSSRDQISRTFLPSLAGVLSLAAAVVWGGGNYSWLISWLLKFLKNSVLMSYCVSDELVCCSII